MASERKPTDAFEEALKREQRSASLSNGADCPAPEVLAAYYDRSLSRSERARVDSHLNSCVRCQSMMASIARADDRTPVPETARGIFWITRLLAPVAVVGIVIAVAIGIHTREQSAPEVIALASPAVPFKPEIAEPAPAPPQVLPEAVSPSVSQPANAPAARMFAEHHHKVGAREKAATPKSEEVTHEEIAKTQSTLHAYASGSLPANPAAAADATISGSGPGFIIVHPRVYSTASADGTVVWHFGSQGVIFVSENSGKDRIVHQTDAELLAGSAPSNDVCWIVGKSGAILRTLDRGEHWQIVKPPLSTDFTGVSAIDSNNATVTALYRHQYVTHDGGVTWSAQ